MVVYLCAHVLLRPWKCHVPESGDPFFVFLIYYSLVIVIHGFSYLRFIVILVLCPRVYSVPSLYSTFHVLSPLSSCSCVSCVCLLSFLSIFPSCLYSHVCFFFRSQYQVHVLACVSHFLFHFDNPVSHVSVFGLLPPRLVCLIDSTCVSLLFPILSLYFMYLFLSFFACCQIVCNLVFRLE